MREDAHRICREFLSAIVLHAQSVADEMGMSAADAYAMNVISLHGKLTAGQIAEHTGLTSGAVTRLIDRLVRAEAVRRVADPADRRRVFVEALPREPTAEVRTARAELAEVFAGYEPEQLDVIFDFFVKSTKLLRNAKKGTR